MIRNSVLSIARQLSILVLAFAFSASAWAVKETVLYSFPENGSTGNYPAGGLVVDKAGNLYGTTLFGGISNSNCPPSGCGTIFELSPSAQPGASWTETVIYSFQGGEDGGVPECTLVMDDSGNLYGATVRPFLNEFVVFELSPPAKPGGAWTETNLYTFGGFFSEYTDSGTLIMDAAGNLYGTSYSGGTGTDCGTLGCGTVFEVSPPPQPGGDWTGAILYSFQCGSDGSNPVGALILDSKGALYGTTAGNDYPCGDGTVFQLIPPSQPGGAWTENVLYSFSGIDGQNPYAGLIFDRKGNLYGTTGYGGPLTCDRNRQGCGNVFELSPPAQPGGAWSETVLYNFTGRKVGYGLYPFSTLIMDGLGNLYGTTVQGGRGNLGTVFELV